MLFISFCKQTCKMNSTFVVLSGARVLCVQQESGQEIAGSCIASEYNPVGGTCDTTPPYCDDPNDCLSTPSIISDPHRFKFNVKGFADQESGIRSLRCVPGWLEGDLCKALIMPYARCARVMSRIQTTVQRCLVGIYHSKKYEYCCHSSVEISDMLQLSHASKKLERICSDRNIRLSSLSRGFFQVCIESGKPALGVTAPAKP